jgi:hypothetical protein
VDHRALTRGRADAKRRSAAHTPGSAKITLVTTSRLRRSTSLFAAALLAGFVLVAAACGGDDDDSGASAANATTTSTTAATTDSTTAAEFQAYIGLTVEAAGTKADGAGRPWRVVMEDGVAKPVTMDFNDQRLNFTVVDGKVTNVTTG